MLIKFLYLFILFIGFFSPTVLVFADHSCGNTIQPGDHLCNPTTGRTLENILNRLVDILFTYGMPFVIIFMVISGFMFVTARGNEEQLNKAKVVLFWTIIGAAVIIGARLIAAAIENFANQLSR